MLFKLSGAEDLSKDDIENLKAHGFNVEFKKVDKQKEVYYNSAYRVVEYYALFIDILALSDLLSICNILQKELIITKNINSNDYDCLEVYNRYR